MFQKRIILLFILLACNFNVIGQTTGLKKHDLIYWDLTGNGINANDLKADHNSISGQSFIKDDGSFSFSLWPIADGKTEGNETISIRFYSDSARTTQVGNTPSVLVTDVTNDTYLISTDKSIYNEGINKEIKTWSGYDSN